MRRIASLINDSLSDLHYGTERPILITSYMDKRASKSVTSVAMLCYGTFIVYTLRSSTLLVYGIQH